MKPTEELQFNKDISFLMEIQRLETLANDYRIIPNPQMRMNILVSWGDSIYPAFNKDDAKKYDDALKKAQPAIDSRFPRQKREIYSESNLNELHRFLNIMNAKYGFQLGKKKSGISATGLE